MLNNKCPPTMVTCGNIVLTPVNGRTVRLTGDLTKCTKHGDPIESLTCDMGDCSFDITVGDQVYPRPKSPHKVNIIQAGYTHKKQHSTYELMVAKATVTSTFALPFLGGNRKLYMWDSLFINAFIETPEHTGCIAVLYRFSGDPLFLKFESALCSFRNFRERIEPDPYHVMFVFDVPSSCVKSYEAFVQGKYSQIDDLWKLKILEFHGYDIDGQAGKILFQSESLRRQLERKLDVVFPPDSELHDKPDTKDVYDPEYYKVTSSKLG